MPRYFIGNILSATEGQPESNDPTFAFTKEESQTLNMEGVPIRMEHHPDMTVGTVERAWNSPDGSKWILGKLDDEGFQAKFAQYAVAKNKDTGHAYYEGLSLQHTHTQYASGKTDKQAVEVSLCVDPRRPNCRISYIDSDEVPKVEETEKVVYKMQESSLQMSAPEDTNMQTVIVEQQKKLEDQRTLMEETLAKLAAYEDAEKKRKEEEEAKVAEERKVVGEKNAAMVDAWAELIPKETMNDEQKQNIMQTVQQFPQETMELLRIAHCASQHAKRQEEKFEEFKRLTQQAHGTQQFEKAVKPEVKTHAASKKRKVTDAEHFCAAMKEYQVSGSARDHMEQIAKIGMPRKAPPRDFF